MSGCTFSEAEMLAAVERGLAERDSRVIVQALDDGVKVRDGQITVFAVLGEHPRQWAAFRRVDLQALFPPLSVVSLGEQLDLLIAKLVPGGSRYARVAEQTPPDAGQEG